jgi:hypothetical protein
MDYGFLYFIEGLEKKPDPLQLLQLGLGYAFDGGIVDFCGTTRGPDGCGAGVVIWLRDSVPADAGGFRPKIQDWQEVPPVIVNVAGDSDSGPRIFVGWIRGAKPSAGSLARARVLRGHPVRLGDGKLWTVPVARAIVETPSGHILGGQALPKRTRLDRESGLWVSDGVEHQYSELWRIAELWWDNLIIAGKAAIDREDDDVTFDFHEKIECALRALSTNYRIGATECEILGLLPEGIAEEVLNATVDLPTWIELSRKKKQATPGAIMNGGVAA